MGTRGYPKKLIMLTIVSRRAARWGQANPREPEVAEAWNMRCVP